MDPAVFTKHKEAGIHARCINRTGKAWVCPVSNRHNGIADCWTLYEPKKDRHLTWSDIMDLIDKEEAMIAIMEAAVGVPQTGAMFDPTITVASIRNRRKRN